jgi:3-deoxy-D-manno-octulosonic-acid transferase
MLGLFIRSIYNLSIRIGYLYIYLGKNYNKKFSTWVEQQKSWKDIFNRIDFDNSIWLHVASVGELQTAMPIIKSFKKEHPNVKIVVSFFSISVLNFYNNKPTCIDLLFLFPKDYVKNIEFIINKISPKALIVVENEKWMNLFSRCSQNKIPIFCLELDKEKKYSFIYSIYIKYIEKYITNNFYLQVGSLKLESVLDTEFKKDTQLESFSKHHKVLILGSCYETEVALVADYYKYTTAPFKIILVPHQIDTNTIYSYQKYFDEKIGLYSKLEFHSNILLVDVYGKLKDMYQYVTVAFVGGGFQNGLHNIFEPAVFGLPILCGHKFKSNYVLNVALSEKLIDIISDKQDLKLVLDAYFKNQTLQKTKHDAWIAFFKNHQNVSDKICLQIKNEIYLA